MWASPWNPGDDTCVPAEWDLPGGLVVHNPVMLLTAGLGIVTGLVGRHIFRRRQPMLHVTFTTFAMMNTSGLVVWCFTDPQTRADQDHPAKLAVMMMDGICSSLTSLNFVFSWLYDYRVLTDKSLLSKLIVLGGYVAVVVGYYGAYFQGWHKVWQLLYVDLTMVGSSSFVLMELLRMSLQGRCSGVGALVLSITIGLSGLTLMRSEDFSKWLCDNTKGWYDSMAFWYTASDLSLMLLIVFGMHQYPRRRHARVHPATSVESASAPHGKAGLDLGAPLLGVGGGGGGDETEVGFVL